MRGRLPGGLSALERVLAWFLLGTALVSGSALLLADLGLFGGLSMSVVVALLAATGLIATRGTRPSDALARRPLSRDLSLVALGVLLLALALPPFEWVLGGRDPGTYVNAALQMRAEHATAAKRPFLREVPPDVLPYLSLWEPDPRPGHAPPPPPTDPYERDLWPGMYLREPDRVLPQGFHLFPALLAAAGSASGDEGLWVVPALALLVLFASALLAGRLAEGLRPAAAELVAGGVLVAGLGFIWYARYPTAELLEAVLLVGGAWLWTLGARSGSTWTSGAAGLVAGAALLTRPDAVLLVPALAAVALALAVLGRFGPAARRFFAWFAVAAGGAGLHAALFAGPYLEDVSVHSPAGWAELGAAVAVALVLAAAILRWRHALLARVKMRSRSLGRLMPVVAVVLLVGFAAVGHVRDWAPVAWLRWHLGEAGLIAGAAGAAVLLRRLPGQRGSEGAWFLLLLAGATLVLYLPDARISLDLPWGFRRFLPVVVPVWAVACGMAAAAVLAISGPRRTAVRTAAGLAGAVVLLQLVAGLAPTLGHREYDGAEAAADRLDAKLGRDRPLVLFGAHDVALHRFGPAIGIGRGRFALPVTALRARRPVDWLLARGRSQRLLLVTYGRRLPPLDRRRLQALPLARVPFSLPEMERPLGRLPRHEGRLSGELVVWRLRKRPSRDPGP